MHGIHDTTIDSQGKTKCAALINPSTFYVGKVLDYYVVSDTTGSMDITLTAKKNLAAIASYYSFQFWEAYMKAALNCHPSNSEQVVSSDYSASIMYSKCVMVKLNAVVPAK